MKRKRVVPYPHRFLTSLTVLLWIGVFGSCAPLPSPRVQQPAFGGVDERRSAAPCLVHEVSRAPLVVEGGATLYVEPEVLSSSGGRILLAGVPNYLWNPDREGSPARDSILGAVIEQDGTARIVPAPTPARLIMGVRAVARGNGNWAVVFAEMEPGFRRAPHRGTLARLWYGEFDGTRWTSLDHLPLPKEGRVDLSHVSALTGRGDSLTWAVTLEMPGRSRDVALFTRQNGRWSYEVIGTRGVSYVEPAYSDSFGVVLAVVQPDTAVPSGEQGLFIYARQPTWRKVASGAEPVYFPSFRSSPSGGLMSWWANLRDAGEERWEARAMAGPMGTRGGRAITLDSSVAHVAGPVEVMHGMPLWVTEHVLSDDGQEMHVPSNEGREIRVVRPSADSAVVLGRMPNPFTGPFGISATSPGELLLAGPLLDRSGQGPVITTLLLRARAECHGAAP